MRLLIEYFKDMMQEPYVGWIALFLFLIIIKVITII
jgi:hypothetical protein